MHIRLNFQRFISKRKIISRPAFLVHSETVGLHFLPIWNCLKSRPFDILLYEDAKIPSSFKPSTCVEIRTVNEVLKKNEKYTVLVSNHYVSSKSLGVRVPLIKSLAIRNIRLMYAAGKLGWNLSDWNKFYDGILCFGPFHAKEFEQKFQLPTAQIGYPRLDSYFNQKFNKSKLLERYNCDPQKKTIVWLPTWKNLSSVGYFDEEVSLLSNQYNIIVKLHPMMVQKEADKVVKLKKFKFNALIDYEEDNIPLYFLADYMLFDYGGPAFAGLYLGKKFLMLNVPGADNDRWLTTRSPELLLREFTGAVNPGDDQIKLKIIELTNDETFNTKLKDLRNEMFALNFGNSSLKAAHCIENLNWLAKDT